MAVPALPASLTTGDDLDATHVNTIRSLLAFLRDDRPCIKVRGGTSASTSPTISNATSTNIGFGTSGSFTVAPEINVGGWTVNASDGNPESLLVPETGYYWVSGWAYWAGNASGRRVVQLNKNGAGIGTAINEIPPSGASTPTRHQFTTLIALAANDELDLNVLQSSGGNLTLEQAWLMAYWVVDT